MNSLIRTLARLSAPTDKGDLTFVALPLASNHDHLLDKDGDSAPCLLFGV